jgi:hypothetical protein
VMGWPANARFGITDPTGIARIEEPAFIHRSSGCWTAVVSHSEMEFKSQFWILGESLCVMHSWSIALTCLIRRNLWLLMETFLKISGALEYFMTVRSISGYCDP